MRCLHGLGFAWVNNGSYYDESRVCRLCGLVQEYQTTEGIGFGVDGMESFDEWVSVGYADDPEVLIKQWRVEKQQRRFKKRAEREAEEQRLRSNIIKADRDHAQEED